MALGSLKKSNKSDGFSRCRVCEQTGEINEFGFCRKCVQERARRLIQTHDPRPANVPELTSPASMKKTVTATDANKPSAATIRTAAPFQSSVDNATRADAAPIVADHNIVAEWESDQKQRKAESDRRETKRIEEARDREIAAFKANIADVKIVRDIGNALVIEVRYHRPVSNKSRIVQRDPEEVNDFFKILTALRAKAREQTRQASFYESEIAENVIKIKMDLKPGDTFVTMISGGNYDFKDGTTRGYWLVLALEKNDEVLLRILVKAFKKLGFIFLSSPNSATGLLQRGNISYEDMGRILEKVKEKVIEELPPQPMMAVNDSTNGSSSETVLPEGVPRKIVDSILSDLADIKTKEIYHMIKNGYAYNDRQAAERVHYDDFVLDLARSHDLSVDVVRQIVSYWVSIQRK